MDKKMKGGDDFLASNQRDRHIEELVKTESDHVRDLQLTLDVFHHPLLAEGILTTEEVRTLFINWNDLLKCSTNFLNVLQGLDNKAEEIGAILVEQLSDLQPYVQFCRYILEAIRLLQKYSCNPVFAAFDRKCASDKRLPQKLQLNSYLSKPFQRLTKYPLIIGQILKYTHDDDPDRQNIKKALETSQSLCTEANEACRSQENSSRLRWLQERVSMDHIQVKSIFDPETNTVGQRKYILHGPLQRYGKKKELQAFLFNDYLLFCKAELSKKGNRTVFDTDNFTKFKAYKQPLFLNEIFIEYPPDRKAYPRLFHVVYNNQVLYFRAESQRWRDNWVERLQTASKEMRKNQKISMHFISPTLQVQSSERGKKKKKNRAPSFFRSKSSIFSIRKRYSYYLG